MNIFQLLYHGIILIICMGKTKHNLEDQNAYTQGEYPHDLQGEYKGWINAYSGIWRGKTFDKKSLLRS